MADTSTIRKDVVVLGGGPAGFGAAVAAARLGAEVLLVERNGFLGGNVNLGLALHTFHGRFGNQVVKGIPDELISRMVPLGGTVGPVKIHNAHMFSTTPVDPEVLKYVALDMLEESGVDILLHTFAFAVEVQDGQLRAVKVANKSGVTRLEANVFIDATGDGDIAALAGAPYEKGLKDPAGQVGLQPMSLLFKMMGVDIKAVVASVGTGYAMAVKPGQHEPDYVWFAASLERWKTIIDDPSSGLPRNYSFWGNSIRPGEVNINGTRILGKDGTSARDLTRAEVEGRRQVARFTKFLVDNVPGFEHAYIIAVAPFVGVRETRRIMGDYILTRDDLRAGREFPDGIARAGYPIDIHSPRGGDTYFEPIGGDGAYDIPYRCLLPQGVEGLLVAGRSISATAEAMASLRVMIVSMATGQAAGTAAALAAASRITPRQLSAQELRRCLVQQGAIVQGSLPGSRMVGR